MHIKTPKSKVMSVLNSSEQHQAVLLDGAPLQDVDKFKHLGALFIANCQGTNLYPKQD